MSVSVCGAVDDIVGFLQKVLEGTDYARRCSDDRKRADRDRLEDFYDTSYDTILMPRTDVGDYSAQKSMHCRNVCKNFHRAGKHAALSKFKGSPKSSQCYISNHFVAVSIIGITLQQPNYLCIYCLHQ
jgi:hypothetical protein